MKILFAGLLATFAVSAAGMFSTAFAQTAWGVVTDVEPAYQTNYVNRPSEQCQVVQVPVYGRTGNGASGLEVIGGALIGGLFGKAVTDKDEGAIVSGEEESAEAKKRVLRECGVSVVDSPADIGSKMAELLGA